MRSIIALVDFTENSTNAARYAADMAAFIGADLHLVHVLDLPDIPIAVPIPDYALDEMRNSCFNSLETLSLELKAQTDGKIQVSSDLETGNLFSNVKNFCQWKKPFLVVMGASSKTDLRNFPFPLLIIPANASFHSIKTIVLACDQEEINTGIPVQLDFLTELKDLFSARFDVLTVTVKDQQTSVKPLDNRQGSLVNNFPEVHFTSASTIEEGVRVYLDQHPADWLMVFPKRSGLFHTHKSISKEIILNCPLPSMRVPKNG
jgi:nucleotide-binding universal stress UspA family protein